MLRGQAETCSGSQASPQPGGSHGAHLTTPSAPSCLFPGSTYGCNLRLELPRLLPGPRSTGWQENSTFIYLFVGLLVFDISQTRFKGFPGGARGKEPACQCRRCKRPRFDPWVGKVPWRRARQLTPVFLPGESHGQRAWRATVHSIAKSQTRLKQLSTHAQIRIKGKGKPHRVRQQNVISG